MLARLLVLVLLAALAAGCKPVRLKTPDFVANAQELGVQGYRQGGHGFREKDLAIGSYRVTAIDHDWDKSSSLKAGPHGHDTKKKGFRFDVKGRARTLHAECTEEARKHGIAGFLDARIKLTCTCSEGSTPRLSFVLANGRGTAQVAGVNYQLAELHQTQEGGRVDEALGYDFKGLQARGAVDLSGSGRAWLPPNLSEDEELALVCGYASLLVYRPTTTLD